MKKFLSFLWNPFIWFAGIPALLTGLAGIVLCTLLCQLSGIHFHGWLHLGAAPNNTFGAFLAEHIIIWLIPAFLFYISSLLLSSSRIRAIDVFGTTAFAQLPLIGMGLFGFLRPVQLLIQADTEDITAQWLSQPEVRTGIVLILIMTLFLVWSLIWMFKALKVACNLRKARLGIVYVITLIFGDILTTLFIQSFIQNS